jgi:hypothetical protein
VAINQPITFAQLVLDVLNFTEDLISALNGLLESPGLYPILVCFL